MEANHRQRILFVNLPNLSLCVCTYSLTCDGEIAWAVGLSSVILSKAGVDALIIGGGVEDLQTPIKQDGNPKKLTQFKIISCLTVDKKLLL